ncbi:MAG TPA: methyl-accepting chemotaxis protein [Holophagaceae bacterium]
MDTTLASLEAIRDRIGSMATRITDIGGLSRTQADTGQQVANMMAQNASATHELASTVQEIAKTSDELARVAEGLRAVVQGFKL